MVESLVVRADDGVAFEDGEDRGRILASGADTGGRYGLIEWSVAPGWASPDGPTAFGAHRHREIEETFLVRRGSLEFLIGDEVRTLRAGDFVRVPPGVRHGYANLSGAAVELLVSFYPGGLESLFLKYRTDSETPAEGEGFISDATRLFASEFEDH